MKSEATSLNQVDFSLISLESAKRDPYGPLPPPYFLLSKAESSCFLTPPPSKGRKN